MSQDINIEITKKDKSCDQIKSIKIINFRSYENFGLEFSGKPVGIIGDNGIGKTNILEAISLFSPGRGMRNASFSEMIKDLLYPVIDTFSFVEEDWGILVLYVTAFYIILCLILWK